MIFAVLVAEFELTGSLLLKGLFLAIEFVLCGKVSWAVVIGTFVDGEDSGFFPEIKSVVAKRTPVLGFYWTMMTVDREEIVADFASQLDTLLAVIVIDVLSGSVAVWAADGVKNRC